MSIVIGNLTFNIIAILTTAILGTIIYVKWRYSYWTRTGLPSLNPVIPFGDTKNFLLRRCSFGVQFKQFYDTFKAKGHKQGGVFLGIQPFYVPIDIEIIKCIMQKDFQHFMNRGNYFNEEVDPLSAHLFNIEDTKWKNMRIKLTPTFTSGKLKLMFQTLADCTVDLTDIMDSAVDSKVPIDIKEILARFITDIIGSVAFGLECNSIKNPEAEFRKYGRKVPEIDFAQSIKRTIALIIPRSVLHAFKFKLTKPEVEKFFMKVVRDTVEYREVNNIHRKDFMDLLLQLKNRGSVADDGKIKSENDHYEHGITLNELSAQAFAFFVAGFETTSTTMTFALYELAVNPHIQDKIREEINSVLAKHSDKLTYEGMMEMTYMEKVLHETLRKYPPLSALRRVCTKDYTVPDTTVHIKKGDRVCISVLGLHYDPEYYPDPQRFDPERFSNENKNSRPAFSWLPFGEGPRLCIGLRFGMLQSKVGLTALLKKYRIKLSPKTVMPLKFEVATSVTTTKGKMWLDLEKLN